MGWGLCCPNLGLGARRRDELQAQLLQPRVQRFQTTQRRQLRADRVLLPAQLLQSRWQRRKSRILQCGRSQAQRLHRASCQIVSSSPCRFPVAQLGRLGIVSQFKV